MRPRLEDRARGRLAAAAAFVILFFAGASLAAGAGDSVVDAVTGSGTTCTTSTDVSETPATDTAAVESTEDECKDETTSSPTSTEGGDPGEGKPAPTESEPPETSAPDDPPGSGNPPESPDPPEQPEQPEQPDSSGKDDPEAVPPSQPAPNPPESSAPPPSSVAESPASPEGSFPPPGAPPAVGTELELENEGGAIATIWLHRELPDPTPRAKRLTREFARDLRRISARAGVHWSLVLGVIRARGLRGRAPVEEWQLERLSGRLARLRADRRPHLAVLELKDRRRFVIRVVALARYNRAASLRGLVRGLRATKPRLARWILKDERIDVYEGGRADIAAGRINVRVLVLLRYLAEAHRQVTVSSLETGHRLFSRPGVISAHVYGLAVDVAGLNNKPIYGNQEPGGLTERAVRTILRLPAELQPRQVISLLGLGGASFPLGDHDDHIHVGY
jgi:outer membrane biosynthesis protein TonB